MRGERGREESPEENGKELKIEMRLQSVFQA